MRRLCGIKRDGLRAYRRIRDASTGAFDETFAAAAVSACDLTHAFSTPAAIGRVINPTLAASGVPARTLKGLKLIN